MRQMYMPFDGFPARHRPAPNPERSVLGDLPVPAAGALVSPSGSAAAARWLPPSAWSLSALPASLPLPMFRLSARGRIVFANGAALRLFGLPEDTEPTGLTLRDLCPDAAVRRRLAGTICRQGQLDGAEADFLHVSGRRLRMQVYAHLVDDGHGGVYIDGALFDVTARELAIAELEDTKRRLLSFFDRSPVGYWIEDFSALGAWLAQLRAAGVTDIREHLDTHPEDLRFALDLVRIVDVNPAALALVGARDKSAVLEGGLAAVVADKALDSFREQIVALWDGHTSLRSVGSGTTLDGDDLEYVLTWVITLDDGPHLGSVVVSIEDVTKLRQTSRQLAAVSELKDHFIRSLSHELRTPLTGVVGFAALLKEHWPDRPSPEVAEYLEVLVAESAAASDVIDNLVIAAQLASDSDWSPGSGRMEVAVVDLGDLARDAISTLAYRLDNPVEITGKPAAVLGDDDWLRLIIRNLINNAIRHGGARITVTIDATAETVRLVVSDDGDGVPGEVVESAFELFVGRATHPGLSNSLGLGLAVSRSLARAMGGDLRYERIAKSSAFTLELPAARKKHHE